MTRSSNGAHTYLLSLLFCMLASSSSFVTAQAPPPQNSQNGYYATNFSPSMAIVIVVLISAFFFLAFFSIYVRQCSRDRDGVDGPTGAQVAVIRRQRGLDRATIETFPTMLYSEAKEHKIGKGALECAVCLSEFEEDEALRLLPKCSHVFHPDCIDAWLTGHVTCPVCRDNLAIDGDSKESTLPVDQNGSTSEREIMSDQVLPVPTEEDESREDRPEVLPAEAVVIQVDLIEEEQSRREEMLELERIGSVRRALRSKSSRRPPRFPRSHSTGHSLSIAPQTGGDLDRYTLRLPEPVLRSIIVAGKLKRTASLITFAREGSSRAGYRGAGEDSSRGGRSVRMGMSGRWPSFLGRNLSEKISSWGIGRRGENGEGSVKKGDGEGSTKGKSGSVRFQFD